MSLQRSGTRKGASAPAKPKKDYSIVQQGIKELYPLDKANVSPDVDIVLVPGLGAHPEDCWKSDTGFNWTTEGLVRDFPRARVLLYMYESAWSGSLKVKQFMSNVAMGLLVGLRSKREGCQRRPIVFIGHSMGGLVIAKAISTADSRRDRFPIMFEAIAAAIFFGTPFGGAPVASAAVMYSYIAEKIGTATTSKLLELMKPDNEGLRELTHEFMRLVGKLNPKIDLFCFYEEQPTDFSKKVGLPMLSAIEKKFVPKQYSDFVSRESATLQGVDQLGIAANHSDLVKFDGPKDERWNQFVRDPIKRIIHGVHLNCKNRFNSVRDIDRNMIKLIMSALDSGAQVDRKRKALAQTFSSSSWITNEEQWVAFSKGGNDHDNVQPVDCLWIRGAEGRGKTSASLTVIEEIEKRIKTNDEENSGQDPVLLAYFFCDPAVDYSTAEDVLKSVITQLINQQETLAPYCKVFAKPEGKDGGKSRAQVTVENLWQSLQDMLTDEFIGSEVIFVLNNLHVLPEDSDSTIKLMRYINAELQSMQNTAIKRVPTRWFITSRQAHNIGEALKVEGVRLVDLEDSKYGDQVQLALRKHAKSKLASLREEKNYSKALAYFASSLIGLRATNTQWIDITVVQLEELPKAENDLTVRRVLETMPQDLKSLLNNAWLQVFQASPNDVEKIKEMLRALVLTYEDPTEPELGVLAGLCSTEAEKIELRELVEKCKPLLAVRRGTVCFINVVVKNHLLENSKELLGYSSEEIKWQHGVLALRSLSHIKDAFDFEPAPPAEEPAQANGDDNVEEPDNEEGEDEEEEEEEVDDDSEEDYDEEDEEEEDEDETEDMESPVDPEASILVDRAFSYPVKNWLRHASKATREIAEDLSLEDDFWQPDSRIRRRWLVEYCRLTSTFDNYDYTTLNSLHIAASIGFRQLVAALIRNGYENEISVRDSLVNTPLHFAAGFGRPKIVEELLDKGASIDDGDEIGEQTPLHMAAFGGHVDVMNKLVRRGANPNATSNDIGPVVNAAISSGNRAAVELLVEQGVSLTTTRDDVTAPLALAALLSDVSMFEYLIEKYADKLPTEEYSKALVEAAEAGRVETFNKLLEFQHTQEYFQRALDVAAAEWNWDICTILLERRHGLDCNSFFYKAATGSELQDKLLERIWQYSDGSITTETLSSSLYDATDREKESTVELLIKKFGADPNATGEEYGNALTAAAFDGTIDIVKMLVEAGANVNSPDGWALQTAAAEGHYDVVQGLLRHGAHVNAQTTNENFIPGTALQGACEAGHDEIVRLLLDHGADPDLGSGEDSPPVIAAAMRGEEAILEMLVKKKAKLDVFGGWDQSSTLINAAAYMSKSSLQLLLDAGADINLQDNDGDTALIVAAGKGDVEAVEFLLDSGADIMHSSKRDENALQAALSNGEDECLKVLIDRTSELFRALNTAMDSGNTAVSSVVRSAMNSKQGLTYNDSPRATPGDLNSLQTSAGENDTHGSPEIDGESPQAGTRVLDGVETLTKSEDIYGSGQANSGSTQVGTRDPNGPQTAADGGGAYRLSYTNVGIPQASIQDLGHGATSDNDENGYQNSTGRSQTPHSPLTQSADSVEQHHSGEDDDDGGSYRSYEEGDDARSYQPDGHNDDDDDDAASAAGSGNQEHEDPEDDTHRSYGKGDDANSYQSNGHNDDGTDGAASTGSRDTQLHEHPEDDTQSNNNPVEPYLSNTVDQLSVQLKSALGNQVSMFNHFNSDHPEEQSNSPVVAELSSDQHSKQHWQRELQPNSHEWITESPVIPAEQHNPSKQEPTELPSNAAAIRRKPAPRVSSYEAQFSQHSRDTSPKPLNTSGYQPQPADFSHGQTKVTVYQPIQETTNAQYHTKSDTQVAQQDQHSWPNSQTPAADDTTPSSVSHLSTHDYHPSQPSQATTTGIHHNAEQYQSNSMYDGSHYGSGDTQNQYQAQSQQQQQQIYTAYHPDAYQSSASLTRQQQQHTGIAAYNANDPNMQMYQNQAYQDPQYQAYYNAQNYNNNSSNSSQFYSNSGQQQQYYDGSGASYGNTGDWQQQQQHPQNPPRPEMLKQRTSSFFTGGMKTTLDKAKLMGNGMFARKQ